jgi:hypothetical protein
MAQQVSAALPPTRPASVSRAPPVRYIQMASGRQSVVRPRPASPGHLPAAVPGSPAGISRAPRPRPAFGLSWASSRAPRLDSPASVSTASPSPAGLAFPRRIPARRAQVTPVAPASITGCSPGRFGLRYLWPRPLVRWAGPVAQGRPWSPRRTRHSGRRVRRWSWPARGALGLGAGQAGPPRTEALDDPLAVHDPVPAGHRAAAPGLHRPDRLQPRSR